MSITVCNRCSSLVPYNQEGTECTCINTVSLSERKNDNKLRVDLVPPEAIEAMARVLTFGATKYAERNWEKGHKFSTPYASLMRHLLAYWSGEDTDKESGLSHLDHAIVNIAMLIYYEKHYKSLDDRSKK
jgi:hypothetical protein